MLRVLRTGWLRVGRRGCRLCWQAQHVGAPDRCRARFRGLASRCWARHRCRLCWQARIFKGPGRVPRAFPGARHRCRLCWWGPGPVPHELSGARFALAGATQVSFVLAGAAFCGPGPVRQRLTLLVRKSFHVFELKYSFQNRDYTFSRSGRGAGPGPLNAAPAGKRHLCRACQREASPGSARSTGLGPLNAAPATTNDTCVVPANTKRAPRSANSAGPGPLKGCACQRKRHLCRACQREASPRKRARHQSGAPKCCACQYQRHLRTCQREASPRERAQHKRHLCRACQRQARPRQARAEFKFCHDTLCDPY